MQVFFLSFFFFIIFLFKGTGGEVHFSVNVTICEGKMHLQFLFCNLFPIFLFFSLVFFGFFLQIVTYICISKKLQVQEYVYRKFLCSDSLFSFLHAEVIFSEK